MNGTSTILPPFRDNEVLDILHIGFNDLARGRYTKIEKIHRIMQYAYPDHREGYLKRLVNIIINSQWFERPNGPAGTEVHLLERGVEFYISLAQHHRAEKWSKLMNRQSILIIILTIVSTIASIFAIINQK